MIRKICVFSVLFCFTFGCNKTASEHETIVETRTTQKADKLSSIFSQYRFIPLETTDEALVDRRIGKIKKHNKKYYISCNEKTLLIFDEQGKFISNFNQVGAGPDEYAMLLDFDILENGDIVVLDVDKIHFYNGQKKYKTLDISITGANIKVVNNQNYLIYASGEKYSVYLLDEEGSIISQKIDNNNTTTIGKNNPFVSIGNNKILFQYGFTNDILLYDGKNNIFENLKLINDNRFLSLKDEQELKREYGQDYLSNINKNVIGAIVSCDNYMLFTTGDKQKHFILYVKSNEDKCVKYEITEDVKNDITGTETFAFFNNSAKSDADDCIITYQQVDYILSNQYDENNLNPALNQLLNQLKNIGSSEELNPILIELKVDF